MDAPRFDALTRAVSIGSRRGLLMVLLALPGLGGLLALLEPDEAAARKKRKRRCKRKSRARICANRCGIVKNRKTCKKKVNCGSCSCDPPCPTCQICQVGPSTPGACVPDVALEGQPCGGLGEECLDGVCVQTCTPPTVDLQHAIDATPPGGELILCAGTWALAETITITQNLTLRGFGAELTILDGQEAVRVLSIAGGIAVTLHDLAVTKGNAGDGGGITNAGTLVLRGVAVTDNATTDNAGGIFNTGTLTLQAGSRVAGNTAGANGGGIYNFAGGTVTLRANSLVGGDTGADANAAANGGGIYNSGTLTVRDVSRVAGNTGRGISNDGGTVTLQNDSQVVGNTTTLDGGGIVNRNGGMVTLRDDSQVAGNSARFGGGINNVAGTVTMQDASLVGGNTPTDANTATEGGGGIVINGGTVTLLGDSQVRGNTASTFGGGINNVAGTLTLQDDSQVLLNTASFGGGGIFNDAGTVTLKGDSRVRGNTCTFGEGGGISKAGGTVTVETDAFVCDNSVPQCLNVANCPNPESGVCP